MDAKERLALKQELEKQGFAIKDLGSWPAKATYYKPTGESMPNLPADPYSMQRYLGRGFTLVPPVIPPNGSQVQCDICGFEAKSNFGLLAHKKKHKGESMKGENG